MMTTTDVRVPTTVRHTSQQVVVVSKQSQLSGLLETVLDAGHYDVVFVESTEHAYSHIKRLTPHLIIVCLDIDDLDGFQVLSMLKLDSETRSIPVVTCTVTSEEDSAGGELFEVAGDRVAVLRPECVERLQDHQIEGAVRLAAAHEVLPERSEPRHIHSI